jgi:hypothetical protein
MNLSTQGVKVETRWVPAHVGITGNEEADLFAKNGAQQTTAPCTGCRTTITYLRRNNRQTFYSAWGSAVRTQVTSWKYSQHFAQWNLRDSVTFFRFFCRRTNFDQHFDAPTIRCVCRAADITSIHLLRDCCQTPHLF